jgi:hypothetical protein
VEEGNTERGNRGAELRERENTRDVELHLISHPTKSRYQATMWPEIGFSI